MSLGTPHACAKSSRARDSSGATPSPRSYRPASVRQLGAEPASHACWHEAERVSPSPSRHSRSGLPDGLAVKAATTAMPTTATAASPKPHGTARFSLGASTLTATGREAFLADSSELD